MFPGLNVFLRLSARMSSWHESPMSGTLLFSSSRMMSGVSPVRLSRKR